MRFRFCVLLALAVMVTAVSAEQLQAQLFRRGCCNNRVQAPRTCCQPVAPQATCCAGTTMAAPVAAPSVVYSPTPVQMAPTQAPAISYGLTPVYSAPSSGCCGQQNVVWGSSQPVYDSVVVNPSPPTDGCPPGQEMGPDGDCVAVCPPGQTKNPVTGLCEDIGGETCQEAYTNCMANCGNCSATKQAGCNAYCLCSLNNCNGGNQPCGRPYMCAPGGN